MSLLCGYHWKRGKAVKGGPKTGWRQGYVMDNSTVQKIYLDLILTRFNLTKNLSQQWRRQWAQVRQIKLGGETPLRTNLGGKTSLIPFFCLLFYPDFSFCSQLWQNRGQRSHSLGYFTNRKLTFTRRFCTYDMHERWFCIRLKPSVCVLLTYNWASLSGPNSAWARSFLSQFNSKELPFCYC
jgi:hypothetical protein